MSSPISYFPKIIRFDNTTLIKYSDTDAMFDRQVKKALREFGIPEDVIQEQNFKYG